MESQAKVEYSEVDKRIELTLSRPTAEWMQRRKTEIFVLRLKHGGENEFHFMNDSVLNGRDIEVMGPLDRKHPIMHVRIGDRAYQELLEKGEYKTGYNCSSQLRITIEDNK